MKINIKKGETSKLIEIFISDSDKTDGSGLTGVAFGDITGYYYRSGATTSIELAALKTMTVGTWVTEGFKEIDATNMPGYYQFGIPNAALVTGADQVNIMLKGATNMAPLPLEIQFIDNTAKDIYDIVNHAVSGLLEIFRKISNIEGFVRHGIGISYAIGTPYYYDPVNGNDANDGLFATTAKLTYAAALALTTAYNHDSVLVVNSTGAPLVIDLNPVVNVAKVHLIGDGNTTFKPTSSGNPTVVLSAIGAHLEGLKVETHTTGNDNAIEITADECEAHNFSVPQSRGSGVVIDGANDCIVHDFRERNPGSGGNGHGVQITGDSTGNRIHDYDISGASGDGINLNGANVSENTISSGDGSSIIHECLGWGIREQGGAADNEIIGPNLLVEDNTAGNFSLSANTINRNTQQFATEEDLATAQDDLDILTGTDGATLATLQANYAPSKAGDQMNLVADQSGVTVGTVNNVTNGSKDSEIDAIKAKTDNLPDGIKKNTALNNFEFELFLSSDHVTAATGLTGISCQRSINGSAFSACDNAASEVGSGTYKINLSAADLNGDVITLFFSVATADDVKITIVTAT